MGIWVAHGEGKFHFPDPAVKKMVDEKNLACVKYCNDQGENTEEYPFCPNGSPDGIAAMCSEDGRMLAMMPHPERVFLNWQWPHLPRDWIDYEAGAWLQMFQNAKAFCDSQQA